ncbi:MAG: transcription termination factor NusA [Anaerolineaceae bacterium]|nr:transcription termination factor NusA [Anaerolineaceae bacterium]
MRSEFELAFNEITDMRSLPRDVVIEALQTALVSAYRRDTGASLGQKIEAIVDSSSGQHQILVEKEVVDSIFNEATEVLLGPAKEQDDSVDLGDTVMIPVDHTTSNFGYIAAQTAKQVILQKIRDAERAVLYEEFIEREGDLIAGTVQSVNPALITLSLGRAEAILPRSQQIPGERVRPHEKLRTYVLEVKMRNRGPEIVVSRAHRNMLRRLLEYEVPEIFNGQVEIKNIAREAGYRSKVAVAALQDGVDPVGACVGMRGIRIQNIVRELHDEKIDIIEWNPDPHIFITKALSPARITEVFLDDDPDTGRTAIVLVSEDQLSLAIGREGQNARLAAKLTQWRVDIKGEIETVQDTLQNPAALQELALNEERIKEIERILEKRESGLTIMPEEFSTISQFAVQIERAEHTKREEIRTVRREQLAHARTQVPSHHFKIGIEKLDLPAHLLNALKPLQNIGELQTRFILDEDPLRQLLERFDEDVEEMQKQIEASLTLIELALIEAQLEKQTEPAAAESLEDADAIDELQEQIPTEEDTDQPEELLAAESETQPHVEDSEVAQTAELEATAPSPERPQHLKGTARKFISPAAAVQETAEEYELETEEMDPDQERSQKKDRQQRRQLIYDEELGKTVVRRVRKSSRRRTDWDDYME